MEVDMEIDMEVDMEIDMDAEPWLDTPLWKDVLPYLNIVDIDSLAQAHPKLNAIVESYLKNGGKLTINGDAVRRRSTKTNLYKKYGTATLNLELTGVSEQLLDQIIKCFTKVQELRLRKIVIPPNDSSGRCKKTFPNTVEKLAVIDSVLGHSFLFEWLFELKNLHTIYMKNPENMMLPELYGLRNLTIDGHSGIEKVRGPTLNKFTVTRLGQGVVMREIVTYMYIREELNILWADPIKEKAAIDALDVPRKNVQYFHIPTGNDTPILNLNADCLIYLQNFLYEDDWMAFQESHPAFMKIPIRMPVTIPADYPIKRTMGPLVTHLRVRKMPIKRLARLMAIFTNLTTLEINCRYLADFNVIPAGLRELRIFKNKDAVFGKLFKRLNPTLRVLEMKNGGKKECRGLMELENITEIKVEQLSACELFCEFLRKNRLTLRRLEIGLDHKPTNAIMLAIVELINLESLHLDITGHSELIGPLPRNSLPSLRNLHLYAGNASSDNVLESLDGSQLEHLELSYIGAGVRVTEFPRFGSLKKLSFIAYPLPNVLQILQGLPNLTDLDLMMFEVFAEPDFSLQMDSYLRYNNRKLRFNKLQLG